MMTNFRVPRRPFGSRAGQAMIETALCLLLFMTIFLAIMEFGIGIFTYNFVSYAAREGSRYASTRGSQCTSPCTTATNDTVQTMIRNQVVALDPSQVDVKTTWNPSNTPGNTVTVNVSYPIKPLLGFVLGNITVGATSTMMIAQ
jgi:Flp pilus assembly protein TadG